MLKQRIKQYFSNQNKRTQQITAILVIVLVAGIGTYLLLGSHAATPYASTTADSGTLASGATKQSCAGASDGNCVVFGVSSTQANVTAPGVGTDLTWGISSADQSTELTKLKDLGVKYVREDIEWSSYETSPGVYNSWWVSNIDNAVNLAYQNGIQIDLLVYTTPTWESGANTIQVPPHSNTDYANFMSYLASRYKGKIATYEIWNEENTSRFWNPAPDAAAYANLLKATYPAIHAADPNAKVVFGGLAANDTAFLQAVYNAGGRPYFDIMATHPYEACGSKGDPTLDTADNSGNYPQDSFLGYRDVYKQMLANNDNKPLWLTEFGWSTTTQLCGQSGVWANGVTQSQQADYLTKAYQLLTQDSYVKVAFWYNQRNNYWDVDANTLEDQFGLETSTFVNKPAFTAFQTYAASYHP